MRPLYEQKSRCTYRLEPYWTYELCHGKYLLQFHEEKDKLKKVARQEYYLGTYVASNALEEEKAFDPLKPPRRKFDDKMLPYLPIKYIQVEYDCFSCYYCYLYVQGAICDINKQPRVTTVIYICDENGKNQMEAITEIASCEYEVHKH
jgi:endoplasmic reticulum lectin 1